MSYIYNDYIIWIQGNTAVSDDIIVCDGLTLTQSDRQDAYNHILPSNLKNRWKNIPFLTETAKKEGVSPKLQVYFNTSEEILVTSHFLSTDSKGRRIAYIYCAHHSEIWDELTTLKQLSDKMGFIINENDLQFIRTHYRRKPKPLITHTILLISLLFVFILIIVKLID